MGFETLPPLAARFLENFLKNPARTALYIRGEKFSYKELMARVYSIYIILKTKKITASRIGIYGGDDAETYASVLAVSLYGASYVPLNPGNPAARTEEMIKQSGIDCILASGSGAPRLNGARIINTSIPEKKTLSLPLHLSWEGMERVNTSEAYLLFTSGTSGTPKAVPVLKQGVYNLFQYFLEREGYDFKNTDRWLQMYDLTFDGSVFSLFLPLMTGASCYVVPAGGVKYIEIASLMESQKITVALMPPSVIPYLEPYRDTIKFPHLRYSFLGGESLLYRSACQWQKLTPRAKIINLYGLTETTIACTAYLFDKKTAVAESAKGIVPIGKPFHGVKYCIVDSRGKSVIKGVKGELCISGVQLFNFSSGGISSKQLLKRGGSIFYKTGDIVRENRNKNLEFYGRKDRQVKVNGYRIELGEIDFYLREITGSQAVTLCVEKGKGVKRLYSFIEGSARQKDRIKAELFKKLPGHMQPYSITYMGKIPLNRNGKTDTGKLLAMIQR